jgi:hypothetical protein
VAATDSRKIISQVVVGTAMAEDDKPDNEEKLHDLVWFESLPIREQNAVLHEEMQCTIIPMLEMVLRILNGGDDFADE